ncbi:MAG: A/G-specific adenine glycosylase [Cyanobacteria bacterium]|nr:A/G-specific adenine glycosylase [Cyanobacteriota bacterium]
MASVDSTLAPPLKEGFAENLVDWYLHSHRDLPWRNTKDPYHIWLSEIMLQQTQVNTVLAYYERFLKAFPTIQALAEAPADKVLKLWEGLGYYARCRNLHQSAKNIVTHHGGVFPNTFKEVHALPGIGQSTAGAILTFAYGQKHPILDGNVKRVLTRLYNEHEDPSLPAVSKKLWGYSEALLSDSKDPYSFNQAIMELGATLCTPQSPSCLLCPVQKQCDGFKNGCQEDLPTKAASKKIPHFEIGAGVIVHEGMILIQQRPEKGLLGGLWEFPGGKQKPGESIEETVSREVTEELGIEVKVLSKIATVPHAYTHFKITLHAFLCEFISGTPVSNASQQWKWVLPEALETYAFPKANKKVLEVLPQVLENFSPASI